MVVSPDPEWYLDNAPRRGDPGPIPAITGRVGTWRTWWHDRWQEAGESELGRLARQQGFVVSVGQAQRCGLSAGDLRREVRRGRMSRPARGVVSPVVPPIDSEWGRRRLSALQAAAGTLLRPDHVSSGRSAAILLGLPTMSVPATPELTSRRDVAFGRRTRVHVHRATLSERSIADWYGAPTSTATRTLVDLGRHDRRDAIMAVDAALRENLTTPERIEAALVEAVGWPFVRQARHILALASPLSESPLESITRLALHDSGFPAPVEQAVIGAFRVDFLWPAQRLILEADGRGKYVDEQARWQEKLRERELGRLGYHVERVIWSDIVLNWPAASAHLRRVLARLSSGRVN